MKETVESILATPNSSQKNVMIVDDNNYYRSMRYEYHQLAAKFNTGYLQIYMDTRLELPCESWENSLTIDSADLNNPSMMSKIWVRIQEAISNPVSTIKRLEEKKLVAEQSKLCNNHNVVHNIDKALRKQISQYIREHKEKNSARVLAAQLNDIRQSVMEDAKRGIIVPPADILKADESIDMPKLETWVTTIFLQRCSSQHGHDLVILE
ncbi:putative L-seryl-tRNA(Sec) kinase [Daphnia magna]|uniref:Putative L-seryl-tRNA(Sec) kinase n=1 Tax=Daphnia magna TaxID=35525 RepID=A0A164RGT3_9CRUS|nr:putative L-seryl-tRNA(Sec) kinase [Daphnia magna]